jgi:hypothetical protein
MQILVALCQLEEVTIQLLVTSRVDFFAVGLAFFFVMLERLYFVQREVDNRRTAFHK